MAQAGQKQVGEIVYPAEWPAPIRNNLRRGRTLHERAMRAPIGSNERSKLLARSQKHLEVAIHTAAVKGIDQAELLDWAREHFGEAQFVARP